MHEQKSLKHRRINKKSHLESEKWDVFLSSW